MDGPFEVSFRNDENLTAFVALAGTTVLIGLFATIYVIEYVWVLTVVALAGSGLLLWLWFLAFRQSRVDANESGINVINLLRVKTIPWAEVESCDGGRFLTISTNNGTTIRAWAVQNSNSSHLRNQSGYADTVAKQLMSLRAQYTNGTAA